MNDVARSLRPKMHTAKRSFDAQDVFCPQAINERIRKRVDPVPILEAPPEETRVSGIAAVRRRSICHRSADPAIICGTRWISTRLVASKPRASRELFLH
jgi:hypothetical protein